MSGPRDRRLGGECCFETADGGVSDYPLHEQLLEGVDDSDFRAQTRQALLDRGMRPEQLDGLFSDLPPSERRQREPE
jgi:hypothetical protein